MTAITNAAGREIDFDAAVVLMDPDIIRYLEDRFPSQEAFFAAYCAAHRSKFGQEFEPNKSNPVW